MVLPHWASLLRRSAVFAFEPTLEEGRVANLVARYVSIACTFLSLVVCLWALLLWNNKRTRHHLQKVSTQLLLVCVAVTMVYGIAVALTTIHWADGDRYQLSCAIEMWFVIWSFNFVNWLQGCISLNLIFALYRPTIFNKNVMRWYYSTALVTSIAFATVPAALGNYLWWVGISKYSDIRTVQYTCWVYSSADPTEFDLAALVVIEAPLILITVIMFVSWIMVAVGLFVKKRNGATADQMLLQLYEPVAPKVDSADGLHGTERIGVGTRFLITERDWTSSVFAAPRDKRSKTESLRSAGGRIFHARNSRRRSSATPRSLVASPRTAGSIVSDMTTHSDTTNVSATADELYNMDPGEKPKILVARLPMTYDVYESTIDSDRKKLRATIIRISLYPFMHLSVALLGAVSQIMLESAQGHSRRYQTALYIVNFIGSAWVPLAYSLCAIFADVSLWEATVHWWHLDKATEVTDEIDLEQSLGRNAHLDEIGKSKYRDSPPHIINQTPDSTSPKSAWVTNQPQSYEASRTAVILDLIEEDPADWDDGDSDKNKSAAGTPRIDAFTSPVLQVLPESMDEATLGTPAAITPRQSPQQAVSTPITPVTPTYAVNPMRKL